MSLDGLMKKMKRMRKKVVFASLVVPRGFDCENDKIPEARRRNGCGTCCESGRWVNRRRALER